MNQLVKSLCSEFSRKVRYNLALIPVIPNEKILSVMAKDGWKRAPVHFTQEQIAGMVADGGHGIPYIPKETICDADGNDAVFGSNETVRENYKQAIRKAAAAVYDLKP